MSSWESAETGVAQLTLTVWGQLQMPGPVSLHDITLDCRLVNVHMQVASTGISSDAVRELTSSLSPVIQYGDPSER